MFMAKVSKTAGKGFWATHGRALVMFIILLMGIGLLVYIGSIAKPMGELDCGGTNAGINAFGSCQ